MPPLLSPFNGSKTREVAITVQELRPPAGEVGGSPRKPYEKKLVGSSLLLGSQKRRPIAQ